MPESMLHAPHSHATKNTLIASAGIPGCQDVRLPCLESIQCNKLVERSKSLFQQSGLNEAVPGCECTHETLVKPAPHDLPDLSVSRLQHMHVLVPAFES